MPRPQQLSQYLGDGVYANFDGYHVLLAANSHDNIVIALEPTVLEALTKYINWIKELRDAPST